MFSRGAPDRTPSTGLTVLESLPFARSHLLGVLVKKVSDA
jgi:hypothetical protein